MQPKRDVARAAVDDVAGLRPEDRHRLSRILEAIEIQSPSEIRFAGVETVRLATAQEAVGAPPAQAGTGGGYTMPFPQLWAQPQAPMPWVGRAVTQPKQSEIPPLAEALWPTLYSAAYVRDFGTNVVRGGEDQGQVDPAFLAGFMPVDGVRTHRDEGWTVYQADPSGVVHARKGEAYKQVAPGFYVLRSGTRAEAQAEIDLIIETFSDTRQPGFVFRTGRTPISDYDMPSLLRIYVNTLVESAHGAVAHIIEGLDRFAVPFTMKALTHPGTYYRADSLVVYVPARMGPVAQRVILDVVANCRLGETIPLFTRPLRPGVGVAIDPGDGQSFGQACTRLIGAGAVDAWRQGHGALDARLQAVAVRFRQAGWRLSAPYLAGARGTVADWPDVPEVSAFPRALDSYSVGAPSNASTSDTSPAGLSDTERNRYLEAALVIGRRLCRDAIWSGDAAGWTGWAIGYAEGAFAPLHRASGASLYDGGAGIGLFLAELAARTGDPTVATAAGGALRATDLMVLGDAGAGPPSLNPGFLSGTTGIGWALYRAGEILGSDRSRERGLALAARSADAEFTHTQFDWLAGEAGVAAALLDLGACAVEERLTEAGLRHARRLAANGTVGDRGLSWPSEIPCSQNLVGFGHGVAGPALALMEAHRISGDAALLRAAELALAYERSWFDAHLQAWPDFRVDTTRNETSETHRPVHPSTWCNGSVGIGAARLRMRDLRPDDASLIPEINAAIRHATLLLSSPVQPQTLDLCLCHGLLGAADMLLQAGIAFGRDDIRALARQAGDWVEATYLRKGRPLPCGVHQAGEAPGLMMGLAGIGWFFLRLAEDGAMQSPLLLGTGRVASADAAPPRSKQGK